MEEKYTYIKRGHGYLEFDTPISSELNGNDLGETWADYNSGKFVLLSAEQLEFKEEHPNASIYEVFNMEITPAPIYERTLEDAKEEMLSTIEEYDQSDNVNEFTYNNIPMWLDKATRDGLHLRLLAEQAAGKENTTLWFGTMSFEIPINSAFQLLYAIEVYASACYDRTAAHKAAVKALDSVEMVDAYDYTAGYPEKLNIGSV